MTQAEPLQKFIPLAEPAISELDQQAVTNQLASTFVGPGKTSQLFADELASLTGRKYAIPTTSGTVALSIAAIASGLKPGDEILVPAYGVVSIINAFKLIGLKPRLVDINPIHGCIDAQTLKNAITEKSKAVCYISFLGNIAGSYTETINFCKHNNLLVIEDAAWSLGRKTGDNLGGNAGNISITSFSVPKIITTGQGGAIFTDNDEVKDTIVRLIDQGGIEWRKTGDIEQAGSNLRMSDLNASLGLSQLHSLSARQVKKQAIFDQINAILSGNLVVPEDGLYPTQNVVLVKRRDELINEMKSLNIGAAKNYDCIYNLTPYKHLASDGFTGAEFWAEHALYLPFGIGTSEQDMSQLATEIMKLGIEFVTQGEQE